MRPSPKRPHILFALLALVLALSVLAITPSRAFMSSSVSSPQSSATTLLREAARSSHRNVSVSHTSPSSVRSPLASLANLPNFSSGNNPLVANFAAAAVTTDKADYAPGETVIMTGTGWQPGETVTLLLHEEPQNHADLTLTSVADSSGNFTNTDFIVDSDDLGRAFILLATGQSSGQTAYTTFTDFIVINFVKLNGVTLSAIAPPSITVAPGATIAVDVNVTTAFIPIISTNTRWRSTNYSIASLGDILFGSPVAGGCINHANHDSSGTNTESFNITAPATPGTYHIAIRASQDDTCTSNILNSFTAVYFGAINVACTPPTMADAGTAQTICSTGSAMLSANNPSVGMGTWSVVSGPSTLATQFNDVHSPTATFTPAGGAGMYTLRWTISNMCPPDSTSDVVITVNPPPTTANAGPDQALCLTSGGSATLAANTPSSGAGVWSIVSGPSTSTAQFNSTSSPTATFTPAGGVGTYKLRWTISNSPCTASTSDVNITFDSCSFSIQDPLVCKGPGGIVTGNFSITNNGAAPTAVSATVTLPTGLIGLPNTGTASVGAAPTINTTTVTYNNGALGVGQTATVTYQAQIDTNVLNGAQLCSSLSVTFGGGPTAMIQACLTINCPTVGPGLPPPAAAAVNDQKPGSVLFYNLYTSNAANLTAQNTRINLTNTDPSRAAVVHLFFVDGATCTPADSYVCLTPNQTVSFTAGDIDPGTTGYIVAVASDAVTGCPINFNFLIGDEFVKLSSGHAANLGAESFAALAGAPPACNAGAATATLNFDGLSYNQVPRVVAVDNFPSTADGNNTLVILNRVGGDLRNGASTIGSLFGVLYDEAEQPFSFSLASNSCQFRFTLTNSSLRTTQRLEAVVSAGRTGWLRLWGVADIGLLGSVINFNSSAGVNNFSQGHNLHKLTFTSTSLTIPIIPPAC